MTRILILSDLHGATTLVPQLHPHAARTDVLAVAGDLTTFGSRQDARRVIEALQRFGRPVMAVAGNCDPPGLRDDLATWEVSVDGTRRSVGAVTFLGLGGSLPCPSPTPNETGEEPLDQALDDLWTTAGPCPSPWVLITHQPPYGTTVDCIGPERHRGSPALRRFIETRQPALAVSGHIHEARGVDRLEHTTLVNPGPFKLGYFALARVDDDGSAAVELKSL